MKARSRAHLARNPLFVRCGDPAKLCDHIQPTPPDDREGALRGPIQSMCRPRQAPTWTPATILYEGRRLSWAAQWYSRWRLVVPLRSIGRLLSRRAATVTA